MSNYLSQPIQYAKPPNDSNFELLSKVALMQQNRYDVNHQQIQATLDQFGAMKTLRPEDDAYIAAKLNSITTQANAMGGNLANQSISDQFLSKIKGAAQDPFILNAIEQTKKKAAVDAQIAEYKKKDPNLVNDKNYKDMLDLGGYSDYIAGKTDKLGNLTYNPYVDITTSLHKKAADFSKERGLKEEYLGTENGTFETVDKFGNKVTEREIQQYLYSSLSDAEKTQMQINARADYKYMPQAAFDTILLEENKEQKTLLEDGLARLKAEAKSKSESEKIQYSGLIAETDRKLTEVKDKITKGTFDKSEMYNLYAKDTINSIASNYDILRTTKLDRSDLPFEIMKFEKETLLKEQEISLKKSEMQQEQSAANGSATTIPTETEELKDTGLQVVRKNVHEADTALDAYLKKSNPDKYNSMSPSEQWTYKLHLKFNKPTIAGANATLKTLTDNFSSAQSSYATVINKAKPKIALATKENYNNLIGGKDLNLENLATTMPLTSELLKSKKTFDNLSKEEQLGVITEFAASNLQYNDSLEGDVRTVYERVVDANKAELSKLNTPKAKQVRNSITGSSNKEETGSYLGSLGKYIGSGAVNSLGYLANRFVAGTSYGIRKALGNDQEAEEQLASWDAAAKEMGNYTSSAGRDFLKASSDVFGGEDTNITELESRDLRLKNGKSSPDVVDSFNAVNKDLKDSIEADTSGFMESQKETKAFTFSTDDKTQKGAALAIIGALQANGVGVDDGAKSFTVSKSGTQFKVSYSDKKGENLVSKIIPSLPSAVTNSIDISTQNWANNPNNPNINLHVDPIIPYNDPSVRDKEMHELVKNMNISVGEEAALLTNPSNTPYATISEVRDIIKKRYPAIYDSNQQEVERIISTSYKPVLFIRGGAFYAKMEYLDGKEKKIEYLPTPLGTVKDDYEFFLKYSSAAAKIRDSRIAALKQR